MPNYMPNHLVEFQTVLDNFGGDRELLRDTVRLSLKYLPQHLEKVRLAISNNNPKDLEISAHTIKGSLSIYLYKPAVQAASELEKTGRSGDLSLASSLLTNLEVQLEPLINELEHYSHST
jgi:HPt (histidine-containing phosphotransfer) domain-containing protein